MDAEVLVAKVLLEGFELHCLAQVYERAGKQDLARNQYRVFLSIWKDADQDRPELTDARRRHAVLGQAPEHRAG